MHMCNLGQVVKCTPVTIKNCRSHNLQLPFSQFTTAVFTIYNCRSCRQTVATTSLGGGRDLQGLRHCDVASARERRQLTHHWLRCREGRRQETHIHDFRQDGQRHTQVQSVPTVRRQGVLGACDGRERDGTE